MYQFDAILIAGILEILTLALNHGRAEVSARGTRWSEAKEMAQRQQERPREGGNKGEREMKARSWAKFNHTKSRIMYFIGSSKNYN